MLPLSFNHQVCKMLCPLSTEIIPWPRDKPFKRWRCFILSNKNPFPRNELVKCFSQEIFPQHLVWLWVVWKWPQNVWWFPLSDTNAFHLCCLSESSPPEPLCSGHTQPFAEGKCSSLVFCSQIWLNCILQALCQLNTHNGSWKNVAMAFWETCKQALSSLWKGDEHLLFLFRLPSRIQSCVKAF